MPNQNDRTVLTSFLLADSQPFAEATRINLEITVVSGDELAKITADMLNQAPDIVERIKKPLAGNIDSLVKTGCVVYLRH